MSYVFIYILNTTDFFGISILELTFAIPTRTVLVYQQEDVEYRSAGATGRY